MVFGDRAARFGPFYRRSGSDSRENESICSSGQVWGRPRRNYFAGLIPVVKAWDGPLPEGVIGVEFYTDIEPDSSSVPGWPEWSEGQLGVIILEPGELVAIPVVVTARQDSE